MLARLLVLAWVVLGLAGTAAPARADADLEPLLEALAAADGFDETARVVQAMAATGNPAAVPILERLAAGELVVYEGRVVVGVRDRRVLRLADLATGEDLGEVPRRAVDQIRVNNRLRRDIDAAIGGLTLLSPEVEARRSAAAAVFTSRDPTALPLLDQAIAQENDDRTLRELEAARAAIVAFASDVEAEQLEAVAVLRQKGDRAALATLAELGRTAPPTVAEAARDGVDAIERRLALWST
ncbi:MAG: urea ABC transporter permease subunit UrtB, partial [Pseudomonadota bacterium]